MVFNHQHKKIEGRRNIDWSKTVRFLVVRDVVRILVHKMVVDKEGQMVRVERVFKSSMKELTPRLHHGVIELK